MLDSVPIIRIYKDGKGKPKSINDTVVTEHALTICLDNKELVTLLCSPEKLEYLAIGFLFSEGLIKGKEDLKEIVLDENQGVIEIAIADNILNMVGPLFESEIEKSGKNTYKYKQKKKEIETELRETKEELKTLQIEFGRETKRKMLLNRIRQLTEVGLTADPSMKSEVIILLKVIDKLEDSLLDEHIERMVKSISKRFSKSS